MNKEKAWERFRNDLPKGLLSSSFDGYFKQPYFNSLENPLLHIDKSKRLLMRVYSHCAEFADLPRNHPLIGEIGEFLKPKPPHSTEKKQKEQL